MMAALIAGRTGPQGARAAGPRAGCAARSASWRRRSPATSTTTTRSCWPGCWPASTASTPTSPRVEAQIEAQLAPFATAAERLDEIPGIGPVAAAVIIAEIGVDMTRFPTAGHLCSWAKFSPGIKSSAGKNKGNGSTGHGNRYLARVLGEAAVIAGRTDTFLGERYRRIARRRGKKKAIVAVGRSMLVIIWHLLVRSRDPLPRPRRRPLHASTSTPRPRNATTSANSRPSATPSPSNPPPDSQHAITPPPPHDHIDVQTPKSAHHHFRISSLSLLGTPRRRENGVGSPADADVSLGV